MTVTQDAFLATRELKVEDRCDRCRAQAWIVATKGSQELYFCNHHGNKHQLVLIADGWAIQDDSYKMNKKSESSANV